MVLHNKRLVENPHFSKYGLILGAAFICALFLAVNELAHFQSILNLNTFLGLVGSIGLVMSYLFIKQITFPALLNEKIAVALFILILVPTILVSLSSLINRKLSFSKNIENAAVKSVAPEFNSMYGITRDDINNKIPSHYRYQFVFDGKEYSRALKKNLCGEKYQEVDFCDLKIQSGLLGFKYIVEK